jgi:hypothetical protein
MSAEAPKLPNTVGGSAPIYKPWEKPALAVLCHCVSDVVNQKNKKTTHLFEKQMCNVKAFSRHICNAGWVSCCRSQGHSGCEDDMQYFTLIDPSTFPSLFTHQPSMLDE